MNNRFKTILKEEIDRLEQIKQEKTIWTHKEGFPLVDYAHRLSRSSMRYYRMYYQKTSSYAQMFTKLLKLSISFNYGK